MFLFIIFFFYKGFKEIDNIEQHIWKGGETEALLRLQCYLERKAVIASYGKPKMTPQSLLASRTGLAPYLRFGCLSTRLFFSELNNLYQKVNIEFIAHFTIIMGKIIYIISNLKCLKLSRFVKLDRHFHCTVNCCGVIFSTVHPLTIQTLTEWLEIQSACKYLGTKIP